MSGRVMNYASVLSVSLLVALSAVAAMQTAVSQPPAPVVGRSAPPPPGFASQSTSTVVSRVTQLLINPNGDVDGLLLEDGMQVQFPPHLSAAVTRVVGVGTVVSIQGFRPSSAPVIHAMLITNQSNNASVADQPPDPGLGPPAPPPLRALQASGSIARLLYTDRGDLSGLVLSDRTIVHFPPHVGLQLLATIREGQELSAFGYGTQNRFGRSFEATSVAVNGQPPISIYGPRPPR